MATFTSLGDVFCAIQTAMTVLMLLCVPEALCANHWNGRDARSSRELGKRRPGAGSEQGRNTCGRVQMRCMSRLGCNMALQTYQLMCRDVITGHALRCPADCVIAVVSLITVEDNLGKELLNCSCGSNELCQVTRMRMQTCSTEVTRELAAVQDENLPISCNMARSICEADAECGTAFQQYQMRCRRLWQSRHGKPQTCTRRCRNSLNILYRRKQAKKLRHCLCQTSDCEDTRLRRESMCFKNRKNSNKKKPGRSKKRDKAKSLMAIAAKRLRERVTGLPLIPATPEYAHENVQQRQSQRSSRRKTDPAAKKNSKATRQGTDSSSAHSFLSSQSFCAILLSYAIAFSTFSSSTLSSWPLR